MNTLEQHVYDGYDQWRTHLLDIGRAVVGFPLDEMLAANVRMGLTSVRLVNGKAEPVDDELLTKERALIEATITYRDAITKPQETAGT